MSTNLPDRTVEPRWLTYTQAIIFTLPSLVAWGFACIFLVPKAQEISLLAGFDSSELSWLWPMTFLFVRWGGTILVAVILMFVLLEFVAPWLRRWRKLTVSIGVWMANASVLLGLTILLLIVLIAAPALAHPQ
ncbi:MAG TPA: hypothetical protein VL361_23465 [Candidatus Limnocylindrales bacterium]|jgi:hypothetical protein|nr:hypothetical protein [Candidatus Limnocylindrales bacterium]